MDMSWSWSERRQAVIIASVFLISFLFIILVVVPFVFPKKVQLPSETFPGPVAMWSSIFHVHSNTYGAIALFSNTYSNLRSPQAGYRFTFYDENGDLIDVKRGRTSFEGKESFFVFERELFFDKKPSWTSFSWEKIEWDWAREVNPLDYKTEISDVKMENFHSAPRVNARVKNQGVLDIRALEAVALVLDESENIVSASKIITDEVPFRGETNLRFSWAKPFTIAKKICTTPLKLHVFVLSDDNDSSIAVGNFLKEIETGFQQGFSWKLSSGDIAQKRASLIAEEIRNEVRILSLEQNPLVIILFPEENLRDYVVAIADDLINYDFVESVSMSKKEDGAFVVDKVRLSDLINKSCVQDLLKIEVYARVLR